MKNLLGTLASATLFAAMFHAPYTTVLVILALIVLSDILKAFTPAMPATRADDAAAWDAIFEEPAPIELPAEEPIILSYRDIQHEIKARYTASQRKELGIKLNASRAVLESWL